MLKKMSMKKRILLLVASIFIVVGIGTSAGRKYIGYAAAVSKRSIISIFISKEEARLTAKLQENYLQLRDSIELKRKSFAKQYSVNSTEQGKKKVLKLASQFLRTTLVDKVYPTWYGTVWDYNGITETPGKGTIACGYFVSTTLRHTGVNVNRYKLAQKYSHAIVKSICNDVKVYNDFESMIAYLNSRTDDVYVVGLDNHVGIISKDKGEIKFIHSSFVYPSHVVSEDASTSSVLGGSAVYVIGNMTANPLLIKSWLLGTAIKVVN